MCFGVDADVFSALIEKLETAPVNDKLKPVLRYVKKLTETPSKMVAADADAIFAAGWEERALTDAVLICGLFNMANRVVDGHGVNQNMPQEVFEESGERLSQFGYLPPDN